MRRRLGAWTLAVLLALSAPPGSALAGSFLDPDARWFTLQWRDGPLPIDSPRGVGRLRPLPDGSILFVHVRSGPNLWRLFVDGRAQRLRWASENIGLATERDGRALMVAKGSTTVERLDLAARRRSTVADLARAPAFGRSGLNFGAWLAPFGDGSIAASDARRIWRIAQRGTIARLTFPGPIQALAPMPGNAVAVLDDDGNVVRLAADGSRRLLFAGASGLGATLDGALVLSTSAIGADSRLTVIDPLGVMTSYPRVASSTLGTGDGVGLREAAWPNVVSITGAADGSLLVATSDHRLRALVPADSPRARIAIAQSTYASFEGGRIAYLAGVPGALTLDLRTHGKTVARVSGSTAGGEGELAFPPQPPSRYDVRLRLATATAVTEGRAVVDTRTVLPVLDATKALSRIVGGDGDDASGAGSDLGRCQASEPRTVSCTVNHFEYSSNIYDGGDDSRSTEVPTGIARAVLRIDGAVLTDFQPLASSPVAPRLRFALPTRQRTPIRVRVASPQAVRAKLYASVRASGVRKELTVAAQARELDAAQSWDARLVPSGRQAATIRTWLAQHRRVMARVQVRIVGGTPWGPATVWESKGSRIVG